MKNMIMKWDAVTFSNPGGPVGAPASTNLITLM